MSKENLKIPLVYDGSALTRMFCLQREFMGLLEKKGKFFSTNPDLTINLNKKPEQSFFREISGFLLEELFEAEENIRGIVDYALNKPHVYKAETQSWQKDLGDEIADCTHFLIELLILAGVDEYVLITQFDMELQEDPTGWSKSIHEKPLETMFNYARYNNIYHGRKSLQNTYKNITADFKEDDFSIYQKICANCSTQLSEESNKLLLQLLRDIHKALRMLKRKPWRNGTELDLKEFQENMGEVWGTYICWLELLGFDAVVMFDTFYTKHEIILQRLTTNY